MEIQVKVRQLGRNASSPDRQAIETAREQLAGLLQQLKLAMNAAAIDEKGGPTYSNNEPLDMWDETEGESVTGTATMPDERPAATSTTPSLEDQRIPLPSNGNVSGSYTKLELKHRIINAEYHLNRIRDLIAEKSCQYSHVIRASPRKGVNTRSRAQIKKLNLQISFHSRMYTQCRSRLERLGTEPATLNRLRKLTPDDVKASTAIVNPNEPGSTRLKLSWIWQSAGGHRWGLGTGGGAGDEGGDIIECKQFIIINTFIS